MTKKKRKIYKNLIILSCLFSGFLFLFSACKGSGSERNLPEGKLSEEELPEGEVPDETDLGEILKESSKKERLEGEQSEESPKEEPSPLQKATPGEEIEPELFSLKTEYEAYPPGTSQIYCILNSYCDRQLFYGCQTEIEVLLDDGWYTLPYTEDASFYAVLHGAKGTGEWPYDEVYLTKFDYAFPEGTYRVVFPCCLDEYEPSAGKDLDHVMYAEFQIQKDAKRLTFCDIENQSLDPMQEIAEGCVVLQNGQYENEEQAEAFIRKASLRIPCRMRVVDCDAGVIRDLDYEPILTLAAGNYWLTTRRGEEIESLKYAFLGSRKKDGQTEVVLSSYHCLGDVWEMGMGFQADWDVEPILTQKEGQEPEWYREWTEYLEQAAAGRMETRLPEMMVSNRAGTKWMNLSFWAYSDETQSHMELDRYEGNGGYIKGGAEAYRTWNRDYPVYVFPVGEEDFGVLFQLTNGKYGARRYSGENGRVTKRLYGEREELLQELTEMEE